MYPYNNVPDPYAPPLNPHHRTIQPHPLNQNFQFPLPQPQSVTPQRSISQPVPQYPIDNYGHNRKPSNLNPGASSFSFHPLEVSSPVDNGFGRLKRYHDDPSALGINYGGVESEEQTYERRISPRKKNLVRNMDFTPNHLPRPSDWNLNYTPPTNDVNYDLPPHMISHTQQNQPIQTPTLHIQRDSLSQQHYFDERVNLGISRSTNHSPINQPQFNSNLQYAQTYHTPPPPLNRAWTLDSTSRKSLSPLTQSHGGLPLTLSPLNTNLQPGRISPSSHSMISAPYDSRLSPNSNSDRRVISLSPNFGKRSNREDSISLSGSVSSEKKYRGYRAKEGGPPKAVLGGPGGKTFDEMIALKSNLNPNQNRISSSSPNLSPQKDNLGLTTPSRKTSGNSINSQTKWKGKPILIKMPPSSYSPPDTPPKPLPTPNSPSIDTDDKVENENGKEGKDEEDVPQKPRKEAFPWPRSKVRYSPPGIPLPLSPDQPGEDNLVEPTIDAIIHEEEKQEGVSGGKEVLVSFPDQDCWERLRPPTPSEQDVEDVTMEEMEAEVSAVLQPNSPMSPEEDEEDAKSINAVEDTTTTMTDNITQKDEVESEIPWDEYPISPTQSTLPNTEKAVYETQADQNPTQDKSGEHPIFSNDQSEPFTLTPHPSLPPRPIGRDDPPSYTSPSSDLTSPSKRSFSGVSLGNADFLKRQLGGALKDPEELRKRRESVSSHIRDGSKGSVRSWRQVDEVDHEDVKEDRNSETASEIHGLDKSLKQKSRMRGWSDEEDAQDDEYIEERDSVSSPARLESGLDDEVQQKEVAISADPVHYEEAAIPVDHALPDEAESESVPKSRSRMRGWSDDEEDIIMDENEIRESVSNPARLEQALIPNLPNTHPAKEATNTVDTHLGPQEDYGVDTTYPDPTTSRLRPWTPSPEPSRLRGWGLEDENDIPMAEEESKSTPARVQPHTHTKSEAEEIDKWKNYRFDTSEEFEEVPLTATEISKPRPWEEIPVGTKLKALEEEDINTVDERMEKRKEKRGREDEPDEDGSKMRAWSEDIPLPSPVKPDIARWTKISEEKNEPSTDFVQIMKERPTDLESLRAQALKSKTAKTPNSKGKGKRKPSIGQSIGSTRSIRSEQGRPDISDRPQENTSNNGEAEDKLVKERPSSPQAKRLRPTATEWQPPRQPSSYGPLGISARPSKLPARPSLTPQATPFVPRATSFDFALPPRMANPDAPPFVPRSTSLTFGPPGQAILHNAPPFIPTATNFNFPPPMNASAFTPFAAPFVPAPPPPSRHAVDLSHRKRESITSTGSTGKTLRPTASSFIPPLSVTVGDESITGPGDRAFSLMSNSSDTKLRPTANTFIPPREAVPPIAAAILKPTATPFVPPTAIDPDGSISPIKSQAGSLTHSELEVGDTSSSTIVVTSPPITEEVKAVSVNSVDYTHDTSEGQEGLEELQDLYRAPSSDEPILSPAEIRFEQHRPDSVESGLRVLPPGRGRADTVAFGASTPIGGGSSPDNGIDMSQGVNGDEERLEDSVVDLEGLFFSTPALTASDLAEHGLLGVREASPRSHLDGRESQSSYTGERSEQSQSTSSSSERPPRDDRPVIKREQENSYHPSDTPSLPLKEPVIPLKQITIHPSHPISLTLTPRPDVEDIPDAPVSAHTTHISGENFGSDTLSTSNTHTARPSLTRPLPPLPHLTPKKADITSIGTLAFSSPAKMEEYSTPPQSTGDTFASAAYMTADGSPLIPTRTFGNGNESTPPRKVRRPLPDIPTWRESTPLNTPIPSGQEFVDPVEVLQDYQDDQQEEDEEDETEEEDDDDDDLVYPRVDIREERGRGFSRSAAPSPELPSTIITTTEEVEPSPDPLTINTKFREWTFPLSSSDEPNEIGHKVIPSIIRRHTMPPEDQIDELDSPPITSENRIGIASTLADRVEELRAYLKADEEVSRRTSVEFPMRENKKKLGIVNIDNKEYDSAPNTSTQGLRTPNDRFVHDERLDEVLELLKNQLGGDERMKEDIEGLKDGIISAVQGIFFRIQSSSAQPDLLERVTSILEEHSRLLTSLHESVNAPLTPTPHPTEDEAQIQSNDLFAAILTGQHAILSKFDEVASTQLSGSSILNQAVEALQFAQAASEEGSQNVDALQNSIIELKEEIEDKQIKLSDSKAENDVLNQRLKDTRQDRDDSRERLESIVNKMEEMSLKQHKLEGELDGVIARALAAELERDALARTFGENRDVEDGLRSQLREYQEQLEKERENSETSLAQKEREITTMQSTIHTQISQLQEQNSRIANFENTIRLKEEKESEEKQKLAKESTIIELSQTATTFQEEMINRLNRIDENMFESMGSRVKEYESVLDRNRILQGEVDSLRERLEASADRFAKLQLSISNSLSSNAVAQEALSIKLSDETERREKAELEMEEMKKELAKVKDEKMNWNIIASERQAMARMQEVRLQALTQENVYWRQFALEHDRKRFKAYMGTKPFKNADGSEIVMNGNKDVNEQNGGNGIVRQKDDNGGTWYVEA